MPRKSLCCVPQCEYVPGTVRHRFPVYEEREFNIWVQRINNPVFKEFDDIKIYKNFLVCDKHFADNCRSLGTKKLNRLSLPTLALPDGMTTSDHRQADTGTSHESLEEREMYDTNYDVWEHEPSSKLNAGPWPISRLGEGLAEVLVLLTNNSISNPENDVELNLEIEVTESILAAMVSDEDRAIESLLDVTIVVPNNSIASSKDIGLINSLQFNNKENIQNRERKEGCDMKNWNKLEFNKFLEMKMKMMQEQIINIRKGLHKSDSVDGELFKIVSTVNINNGSEKPLKHNQYFENSDSMKEKCEKNYVASEKISFDCLKDAIPKKSEEEISQISFNKNVTDYKDPLKNNFSSLLTQTTNISSKNAHDKDDKGIWIILKELEAHISDLNTNLEKRRNVNLSCSKYSNLSSSINEINFYQSCLEINEQDNNVSKIFNEINYNEHVFYCGDANLSRENQRLMDVRSLEPTCKEFSDQIIKKKHLENKNTKKLNNTFESDILISRNKYILGTKENMNCDSKPTNNQFRASYFCQKKKSSSSVDTAETKGDIYLETDGKMDRKFLDLLEPSMCETKLNSNSELSIEITKNIIRKLKNDCVFLLEDSQSRDNITKQNSNKVFDHLQMKTNNSRIPEENKTYFQKLSKEQLFTDKCSCNILNIESDFEVEPRKCNVKKSTLLRYLREDPRFVLNRVSVFKDSKDVSYVKEGSKHNFPSCDYQTQSKNTKSEFSETYSQLTSSENDTPFYHKGVNHFHHKNTDQDSSNNINCVRDKLDTYKEYTKIYENPREALNSSEDLYNIYVEIKHSFNGERTDSGKFTVTRSSLNNYKQEQSKACDPRINFNKARIYKQNSNGGGSKNVCSSKVPLEETPKEYFETKQSEEKAHQDKTNKLPQKQITTLFPNSHLSVDNSIKNISPRGNKIFDNTALEHQSQRVSSFILDKRGQETCKDGGRSIREPELASKPKNLNARIHRGYGLASSCMCDGDMAKKDSKIIYYKAPSSFQNQKKLERENLEKWRIQIKERHVNNRMNHNNCV